MARSLEFYQIYYRDEQKANLYDFAIPYFNETITDYFENSVIASVVPMAEADLVSVCSWKLKYKRMDRAMHLKGKIDLKREEIESADFDIAVLTPVSSSHKALHMAKNWHGEPWIKAIEALREFIKVPHELNHPIYENHFIATREIYVDYVNSCLAPCMDFIRNRTEFFEDSGYAKRKTSEEVKAYQQKSGRKDWPIAPFILERLFSIWINSKNFKLINL
jgi:hypothetical protein